MLQVDGMTMSQGQDPDVSFSEVRHSVDHLQQVAEVCGSFRTPTEGYRETQHMA